MRLQPTSLGKTGSCIAVLCLAFLGATSAFAQSGFPNKTITIAVPYAAGGFTDRVARFVAQGLTTKFNVPVVVENRPGGGGLIAAGVVARAPADGYNLFLANISTNSINPTIQRKQPFDVGEELEAVVLVASTPIVIAVGNEVPVKSVKELMQLARNRKLNVGTPGEGTSGHLIAELLASREHVKFVHIPYKSSPQVQTDLLNGSVEFTIDNAFAWAPLVKAGRVRALAVTSLKRSTLMPEVPTLDESGYPGFQAVSWFGIQARKGTPREVIARLNAEINAVLKTEEFKQSVAGAEVHGGTPEEFRAFIASERARWGEVSKAINLVID